MEWQSDWMNNLINKRNCSINQKWPFPFSHESNRNCPWPWVITCSHDAIHPVELEWNNFFFPHSSQNQYFLPFHQVHPWPWLLYLRFNRELSWETCMQSLNEIHPVVGLLSMTDKKTPWCMPRLAGTSNTNKVPFPCCNNIKYRVIFMEWYLWFVWYKCKLKLPIY